jgi:exodeoxyribonuclease V beta subunit
VAASAEGLGVAALATWLRQRIEASAREGANDDLTRRLESDADAVQVLTIHRAKGLEFPIVYCPFMWEPGLIPRASEPIFFHDADRENRRAVDVGLEGDEYAHHLTQFKREKRGEDLRLAYVALTRARHQAVLWWAAGWNSGDSPLSRLLLAQDEDGNVGWSCRTPGSDTAVFERFREVAARAPSAVSVEWSRVGPSRAWNERSGKHEALAAASFERVLDQLWRRTSYSAITSAAHEALIGSEPEDRGVTDEPAGALPIAALDPAATALEARTVPLAGMAAGPRVGTIVHRALEMVDFTDPALERSLAVALATASGPGAAAAELGSDPALVAAGLAQALSTPLGGALGRLTLRDVPRGDRLDELTFELPLAGGEHPEGAVAPAAIAALLAELLAPSDPLVGYAERLRDPALVAAFRGYLTGSLDLVLRVRAEGRRTRYAIVDYKTNWLGAPDQPLSAWHYRSAALQAEMERSHSALQALLYAVALHRYLRWRAPGYDPETDLIGIHYLFLRGMLGGAASEGEAGASHGVFAWGPPAALVTALSDLLDRGAPR